MSFSFLDHDDIKKLSDDIREAELRQKREDSSESFGSTGIGEQGKEIPKVEGLNKEFSRAVSGQLYNLAVDNSVSNVDYSNESLSYNGGNSVLEGDGISNTEIGGEINFNSAVAFMFELEGSYTNDKNDKGGPTNFGIIQSEYNRWRKDKGLPQQSVRQITSEEAKSIYRSDYWNLMNCDEFITPLNFLVFDTAVLSGPGTARKMLKEAKEKFNKIDQQNIKDVSSWWIERRRIFFDRIVARNPSQRDFLKGWNNRMTKIKNFISKKGKAAPVSSVKKDTNRQNNYIPDFMKIPQE